MNLILLQIISFMHQISPRIGTGLQQTVKMLKLKYTAKYNLTQCTYPCSTTVQCNTTLPSVLYSCYNISTSKFK